MDDWAKEWLRYLESRRADAQADLRARSTITIPSAAALLIGSIVFIDTGNGIVLGLVGIMSAVIILVAAGIYNLKSFVFISGCDTIIREILLGKFASSADVNKEVNELIAKYSATSATTEGLAVVKRTTGMKP